MTLIMLLHIAATFFMTGIVWFVQVVHYPLFALVGSEAFSPYHHRHLRQTTWVVGPVMLLEAFTALPLVMWTPDGASLPLLLVANGLLVIVWGSTALVQVRQHAELNEAWAQDTHHVLVLGNWVRTIAWSARSILLLAILAEVLAAPQQ